MVSDLKTFTKKGCKIAAQKKVCFWANFALLSRIFLVSVFLTPFNGLFAPTSRSPMSKLFRFLEFLGKSNGKKWSQIWKLLLITGVKLPRRKKFVLLIVFICSLRLNVEIFFLEPRSKSCYTYCTFSRCAHFWGICSPRSFKYNLICILGFSSFKEEKHIIILQTSYSLFGKHSQHELKVKDALTTRLSPPVYNTAYRKKTFWMKFFFHHFIVSIYHRK